MPAHFNTLAFIPVKHYATTENAHKAVLKWAERFDYKGRAFNVLIVSQLIDGEARFCPVICNVAPDFFHLAIHAPFNVVN